MHTSTSTTVLPSFTFTVPTPVKRDYTLSSSSQSHSKSGNGGSHRLLYRGSLTLSGSDIDVALEGICFLAYLPPMSPTSLLSTPLPLALESMRGRPSLHVISIVQLSEFENRLDDSADVRMYVNPKSVLTRDYFERVFCEEVISGDDAADDIGERRTRYAVRIRLGDEDDQEDDDILVYGHLPVSTPLCLSAKPTSPARLIIRTARILPKTAPAPSPPLRANSVPKAPLFPPIGKAPKRPRAYPDYDAERRKKMKLGKAMIDKVAGTVKEEEKDARIKVEMDVRDDVFRLRSPPPAPGNDTNAGGGSLAVPNTAFELTNKATIKAITSSMLTNQPYSLSKSFPEFKQVYAHVTKGVVFALRRVMGTRKITEEEARVFVKGHLEMYLPPAEG